MPIIVKRHIFASTFWWLKTLIQFTFQYSTNVQIYQMNLLILELLNKLQLVAKVLLQTLIYLCTGIMHVVQCLHFAWRLPNCVWSLPRVWDLLSTPMQIIKKHQRLHADNLNPRLQPGITIISQSCDCDPSNLVRIVPLWKSQFLAFWQWFVNQQ